MDLQRMLTWQQGKMVYKSGVSFSLPLGTVHRPMIVSGQDETKAPQPSVVQMVQAAEQTSL
jgi:hypothetical protein